MRRRQIFLCVLLADLLYVSMWLVSLGVWLRYDIIIPQNNAMYPEFQEGDIAYYRKQDSIEVGDVVVYQISKDLVCRRVVQEIKDGYITKADACPENDTILMYKDTYVGTVKHIWRNGVERKKLVHSPWIFIALAGITCLI